jgi:hypothetical protein
MGFEVSLVVKAKVARELESDIHLEFSGAGSSYQGVRNGSERFVADYIAFHGIENVQKVEFVYGDKDGLIINTIEDIQDLF